MVRSELVELLAENRPDLDIKLIEAFVAQFFEQITAHLVKKGRVELRGFGIFSVRVRDKAIVRNPKTGEQIAQAEKCRPFFKVGKSLANRVIDNGLKSRSIESSKTA